MLVQVLGDAGTFTSQRIGRRERAVLAVLMVVRPGAASNEQIADAVWGPSPPSTWPKQVHSAIARLRAELGAAAIVTHDHGYRLAIPADAIDLDLFERHIARARADLVAREHDRAIVELEGALRIWRDEPYRELADWPPARAEAERLRELRLEAQEELAWAHLDAGDHRAVAADAARLAAAEPLRERRWTALATALYRCDRQADALAALARARAVLSEELGLDPGSAIRELEQRILRQDPSLTTLPPRAAPRARCPYKGLAAFEQDDAEVFFGRDGEVAGALDTLDRHRAVVLAGPSGAGKSSIIRAGLVPILRDRGSEILEITPTGSRSVDELDSSPHAIAVADHLEGLVTRATAGSEARAWCDALAAHHARGGTVVLAVRTDHLDACATDPTLGPLVRTALHLVAPPEPAALRAAIEEPARVAHVTLEHGLADVVLADAAGAHAPLPLLSHALAETWARREGSTLTIDGYVASGGLRGAVARSAEAVFSSLSQADQERCATILRRLITWTEPDAIVSHPVETARLAGADLERVVDRLVEARLLVTREHSIALAHESLVQAWPRLRGWVASDLEGQRVLEHLSNAAATWENLGHLDADLYRGPRLALAEDWAARGAEPLTAVEALFLAASAAARDHEAAQVREQAERERAHARRLRVLRYGAAVAAVSVMVLAGVAWALQRQSAARGEEARAARESALVSRLTDQIAPLAASDRELANLLAVEIHDRFPDDPRTTNALYAAATAHPNLLGARHLDTNAASGGAVLGNGRVVTVGGDHVATLALPDLTTVGSARLAQPWRADYAPAVRVSADARTAVVLGETADCTQDVGCGHLAVLDIATGHEIAGLRVPVVVEAAASSLAVVGNVVAVVDPYRHAVVLSDLETLEPRTAVTFLDGDIAITRLNDARFAVSNAGAIMILDAATGDVVARHALPDGAAGVAISALSDGTLVSVGERGIVAVGRDGAILWRQELDAASPGPCTWLAGSASLDRIFCGGRAGVIVERDAIDGQTTGRRFDTQHGWVGELAVVGDTLYALSAQDPVLSRWALTGDGPVRVTTAADRVVWDGYSPDGTRLLTAVRPDGGQDLDSFTQFGVWSITRDRLEEHLDADLRFPLWLDDDTVGAYFPATESLGYFGIEQQRRLEGEPLGVGVDALFRAGDGRSAYIVDFRGFVWTLDAATRTRVPPTIRVGGYASRAVASPSGRFVVISMLYDAGTSAVQVFDGETGEAVSPRVDGLEVAAVNDDGIVIAATGFSVSRFSIDLERIGQGEGARGEITSLQFSADGRRYLVSAADQTNTVYDTATGARLAGPIASAFTMPAALSPDGLEVAVTVADGIELWSLDPATLREAACANAGRDLSQAEWDQYLGELGGWRSTCGGTPA